MTTRSSWLLIAIAVSVLAWVGVIALVLALVPGGAE